MSEVHAALPWNSHAGEGDVLCKALTLVCFCCCMLIQRKKVQVVEVTGSAVSPPFLAKATFPELAEHCQYFGKALSTCGFLRWPLENGADVLIVLLLGTGSAVDLKCDFIQSKMTTIHSQSW